MSWLEVETKIKLDKNDLNFLKTKLHLIAKFNKKETKTDIYFALDDNGYPKKAFRIRKTKNTFTVNFKKWLKKYWDNEIVVKEEHEFQINDPKEFLSLMQDLGFSPWIMKIKISKSYIYRKDKNAKIELNFVKSLGYFLEIEYLCEKSHLKKAKKTIRNIVKDLSIPKEKINNIGYTKMLWKHHKTLH